jgi:SRSO17 transposase
VADSGYGTNSTFVGELLEEGLPYVVSIKPSEGVWAPAAAVHRPQEAAAALPGQDAAEPGPWRAVVREVLQL